MAARYLPARTVLFEKERNGVTYRVPSLLYLPCSATFLAFAEERLSADDAHANLLVMRQGSFYKTYVEWGDLKAIDTAFLKKHRSMNPCPLYDEFTGTVFLFFIAVLGKIPESYQIVTGQNLARLCYVTSNDQGNSWSAVTDLTRQVIGGSIKEWATFALGPGHGIQLKSGRLVVPAYTYHIDCTQCFGTLCKTTPHSFTFYSDDHGRNWRFGDFIPNLETVECQVVSVDEEDGTNVLYCNARSPLGFRVQALSTDGGAGFHSGQLVQKLIESQNGCHGSIIGFPAPFAFNKTHSHNSNKKVIPSTGANTLFQTPTWVLYCHPTSPTSRVNLGVYLSTFPRDADSWTEPWIIYEGPSAYSDLAYIELPSSLSSSIMTPTIAFACLFENGTRSPYEQISFSIFTLYEVMQNIPRKSTFGMPGSQPVNSRNRVAQDIHKKATSEVIHDVSLKSTSQRSQSMCLKSTTRKIMKEVMESSQEECLDIPVNYTSGAFQNNHAKSTNTMRQTTPLRVTPCIMQNISYMLHKIPKGNNCEIIQVVPIKVSGKKKNDIKSSCNTKLSKSITQSTTPSLKKTHIWNATSECLLF
ncbi:sialidase-4-like [Lissotriton helveticus]